MCLIRRAPERILFCGWRRDMHDMIAVLDAFVCPGSELWLYNEVSTPQDTCACRPHARLARVLSESCTAAPFETAHYNPDQAETWREASEAGSQAAVPVHSLRTCMRVRNVPDLAAWCARLRGRCRSRSGSGC